MPSGPARNHQALDGPGSRAPVARVGAATPIEAGELMVACLERAGVQYVFGVPGGAVEPFCNALARSARRGGPRLVGTRHPSRGALLAGGDARGSGRPG